MKVETHSIVGEVSEGMRLQHTRGKNVGLKLMVAVGIKDGVVIVADVYMTTCGGRHIF